jgi:large subunit ribosomal protein L20
VRIKCGKTTHKYHKKILHMAQGFFGSRRRTYKQAHMAVIKAHVYAYRDRRARRREFRSLWITRINAATREHGLSYSKFVSGLKKANVCLDRKVLAEIAFSDNGTFKAIVEKAKTALAAK